MLKKISLEVAALIGSITAIATTVYKTEREIQEKRKLEEQRKIQDNKISDQLEEQKDLLVQLKEDSAVLREKLDLYREAYQKNLDNQSTNESFKSPSQFEDEVNLSLNKLGTNLDNISKSFLCSNESFNDGSDLFLKNLNMDLDNINESSLYSSESFNNGSNVLLSFSTSFILASGVVLSAVMGLIFNHYIKLYGDQYVDKVPKWVLPIMKYYLKLAHYSNYYYIVLIVVSQLLILLTSIYLKFRGIA